MKVFEKNGELLSEAINYWLCGNIPNAPIAWKTIASALDTDYVGEPGCAEKIRAKYLVDHQAGKGTPVTSAGPATRVKSWNGLIVCFFVAATGVGIACALSYLLDNTSLEVNRGSSASAEIPRFDEEDLKSMINKNLPLTQVQKEPDSKKFNELKEYCEKVNLVIHTVSNNEKWAVLDFFGPPELHPGVPITEKPIDLYEPNWIVLGMFGSYKAALIHMKQGDESKEEIEEALDEFPNAKFILAIGTAYTSSPERTKYGDVIVSKFIDGVGNIKYTKDGLIIFLASGNRYVEMSQVLTNVFARGEETWYASVGFRCTKSENGAKDGRESRVHSGVIISNKAVVENEEVRENIKRNSPEALGGEMEGVVLAKLQQWHAKRKRTRPRDFGIMVIKGVADFGEGGEKWELTAAMAAASYAEHKLKLTDGKLFAEGAADDAPNVSSTIKAGAGAGNNFELPLERQQLIGRENDMEMLMNYLKADKVKVVTLFGPPGYGKSELALHIGHTMIESGVDVYYIDVIVLPNLEKLIEKLVNISATKLTGKEDKLNSWSKTITRSSLLLLDNFDGRQWAHDDVIADFRMNFTKVVLNTANLKMLITSQQKITASSKFRSHRLHPPSSEDCVLMFSQFASDVSDYVVASDTSVCVIGDPSCTTKSKVDTVCTLVGNVPMAVKVLASALEKSVSIDYVIKRLEEKLKLIYLNETAEPGEKRLLSAFEVAFEFVKLEYQICCLLLAKFPGYVTVDIAKPIITPNLMAQYNTKKVFYMEECFKELDRKSFIESTVLKKTGASADELELLYYFHTLTRDYLNITKVEVSSEVLHTFWGIYFEKATDVEDYEWLRDDLSEEDVEVIVEFLSHEGYDSHRLAQHLMYNYNVKHFLRMGKITESNARFEESAVVALLKDCKKPGLTYATTDIATVLNAYHNIFTHILPQDADYMDKLAMCEAKVQQLYSQKESSDYLALFKTFDFYYTVSAKCESIGNSHNICKQRWKYNLLHFSRKFILVIHKLTQYCNYELRTPSCTRNLASYTTGGIISYNEGKDTMAEQYLHLALKNTSNLECKPLHDAVLNIMLYSIYTRKENWESAEKVLAAITAINFQDTSTNCFRGIFAGIVIPFLESCDKADMVSGLYEMYNKQSSAVSAADEALMLKSGVNESLEALRIKEVIGANNMESETAYKAGYQAGQATALKNTPPFIQEEESQLTSKIANKILDAKASLFCFVAKDMIPECHP